MTSLTYQPRPGGDAEWPVCGGVDDELDCGVRDGARDDGRDGGLEAVVFEGDPLAPDCDRDSSFYRPFPP